ncbi:DNA-binding winged helix-turn-helix (wHTH) protein [Bradyrhizobium sp. USDA 4524]|uniref:winged helix-turn-helix domain-containing protein n=1 Tax=unclassified Bradyrhizobium TaxID=2631580 RepID=UPI0020A11D95|nr:MULTISPECIES: winged helix-turn-helix domain-containing protein [unclassified Bradyrhizobium]MCP1840942.1 DNA-binding winged helix-turn-helix (wHTH) protein [Bradyrhizobium sp. USDA 4538]MCP1901505.1 DNA-binding winged helix-turn-helix (wHTH) protein [Bradyrhizobium sp. USDA 4537]MCP1992839.1 DNA-binding winged helix-turn-helix (wHTH) protein [Bradyrhizobium sp. USDA 4539]
MDPATDSVLIFDSFELDLARGVARVDGVDLDLRPKSFAVLGYLAGNAGRLASKQDLHEAVWGNVAVSDDSLVQCIRELRLKLRDDDHRIIKTVSRRGYRLDARPVPPPQDHGSQNISRRTSAPRGIAARLAALPRWLLIAGLSVIAFASFASAPPIANGMWHPLAELAHWLVPQDHGIVPEQDVERITALAAEKQLPLPAYRVRAPASDVPDNIRRFLGVWVSAEGWINSHRQFMMIVTNVDRDGVATGYLVNGPAMPHSRVPGPGFSGGFTGYVLDDVLRYDGNTGLHSASITADGRIEFKLVFREGGTGVVFLEPLWTLAHPGRIARSQT